MTRSAPLRHATALRVIYARTPLEPTYTTRTFAGDVGYVVRTMGDLTGSDTFIVRNGKIAVQTGVVFRK